MTDVLFCVDIALVAVSSLLLLVSVLINKRTVDTLRDEIETIETIKISKEIEEQ